jgi:hypothetical protein
VLRLAARFWRLVYIYKIKGVAFCRIFFGDALPQKKNFEIFKSLFFKDLEKTGRFLEKFSRCKPLKINDLKKV